MRLAGWGNGLTLAIAASVGLAGAPAGAQGEQTIETAQEFLKRASSLHQVGYRINDDRNLRDDQTTVTMSPTSDKCVTILTGDWNFEEFYPPNGDWYRITGPIGDNKIPWRQVSNVERVGTSVRLVDRNRKLLFRFPSEDLSTRAAFAMEFLRIQCDPTADLGF